MSLLEQTCHCLVIWTRGVVNTVTNDAGVGVGTNRMELY